MKRNADRGISLLLVVCMVAALIFSAIPAYAASSNTSPRHTTCTSLSAQAVSYYTGSYTYDRLSSLEGGSTSCLDTVGSPLFDALHDLMTNTMTKSVSYSSLTSYWPTTDGDILFYSDFESSGYNREHVWPKSHASFHEKNGGCDLHHLRPTDTTINSTRSNYTFGNVKDKLSSYKTKENGGKTVLWYSSSYSTGGSDGLVEVLDNVKGDVARILLYVYVRWEEPNLFEKDSSPTVGPSDEKNDGMKVIEDLNTLLQWCKEDPVDKWEMTRNDLVQNVQGNRNVFIDYPELAWLLFDQDVPSDLVTPTGNSGNGGSTSCSHSSTELRNYKAVTCTSDGYSGDQYCLDCGKKLDTGSAISATGHKDTNSDKRCDICGLSTDTPVISGGTESIKASDLGLANAVDFTGMTIGNNAVTVTASKASGSNAPKYYDSGSAVRFYAKNTLVFTPANGVTISKIVLSTVSNAYNLTSAVTMNNGTLTLGESSATIVPIDPSAPVTITNTKADNGQIRITNFEVTYSAASSCNHTWINATCTSPKTCALCGATDGNALGHDWDNGVVTKEPTVDTEGVKTFTCSSCGATRTEVIDMLTPVVPDVPVTPPTGESAYVKVTDGKLVSGKYVLITPNGYAPGVYESGWVTALQPVVSGDIVTDTKGAVWTLTVNGNSVILTDANGVSIAPKGGNNNGIISGEYSWNWSYNADKGGFIFAGTGNDTVYLAGNTGSSNQYRGYKTTTANGNAKTYPHAFTLYQFVEAQTEHNHTPADAVQENKKIPSCSAAGSYDSVVYCSECGEEISRETIIVPATGNHSWDVGIEVFAPTYSAPGVITYTCITCSATKDEEIPQLTWTAGVINPKSVTLSLDDLIFLNVYSDYTGGTLSQEYIETHGGLIYWNFANYPGDDKVSIDEANAIVVPGLAYNTGNKRYLGTTEGIALKNLGDNLKICSYVELPDGTIMYSRVIEYSGKKYAMSRINNIDKEANPSAKLAAEREVCISMLNAVYEAQKFFKHNLDTPANAELSADRQVVNYNADMITPAIAVDRDLTRDRTVFTSRGASLALEGKIEMTFTFTIPASYMSTAKDTGMLYWSREDYEKATVLDASSATYTGELEATTTADKYSAKYPKAFATKEYEDTVYACAYLIDADGNYHYSGIIAYNVEAYAKSKINGNSAEADLCKALVVYGEAAKAYFAL